MNEVECIHHEQDFFSDTQACYYHERHFNREAVLLKPGHFMVTTRALLMVTILGSCVTVCLRDDTAGVSGMNHFMLPKGESTPFSAPARYGNLAMELLINQMLKDGADRNRLTAKIFGGARILSSINSAGVGEHNASFVTQYLSNEGIEVLASDLRGVVARKVFFFTDTGKVFIRSLDPTPQNLSREEEYLRTVDNTLHPGTVELFS